MRQLFKGVLAAGFGNLVNILLGVVMTKIVAVTAGPAGIALFAQLRQFGQWQTILASVNGAPSVVNSCTSMRMACAGGGETGIARGSLALVPTGAQLCAPTAPPPSSSATMAPRTRVGKAGQVHQVDR